MFDPFRRRHMSYYRHDNASAAQELRATAWRLIAVLMVALTVALLSRLTFGPALF
jgi:hypothetical protein